MNEKKKFPMDFKKFIPLDILDSVDPNSQIN